MEAIFTEELKVPEGKVYELSERQKLEILKLRGEKVELDPGMGGVSPEVLDRHLETSRLASVDLALTSACNFKCPHCYRPDDEWGKLLIKFETIEKVVRDANELGVRYFVLTGGEPTMYRDGDKDYFDVVDLIQSTCEGAKVLTFSDVALIDEEKARKLAERKVGLCLKRDTLDHEMQDAIVAVEGGSRDMLKGYEKLFEAGYGKNPDLAVSVNQVLRKGDLNTLDGAIDLHMWVRGNGMEHSVVPIHYCGKAEATEEEQRAGLNPLEVKALYDILSEIDRIFFNDGWEVYSGFPKNRTCNRPGRGVHIRATGEVTACSESPKIDGYVFGDINKQGLVEMIDSEKFQDFREEFSERKGEYICNSDVCDLNAERLCRGGCATRSAYSVIDVETGLIVPNKNLTAYSKGTEDPLCPAWIVAAQKQGILREGVYKGMVDSLIGKSRLVGTDLAQTVRRNVVAKFDNLR